ncbi:carbon starvation CstA family protein [Tenuifilum thalassicum]|uniref:Carbon starvation protein A n=1 Tax=Tenuifilum thalassicum TaxID=2590900 RepID=A0A7D3XYY4_9BACT|nr:carbon starvation protein A [Tenuifilum thalassicum]QKG79553.1 carbon starvation protein A [Tenuifilum thalassicum]
MYTFIFAVIGLVLGYFVYGRFVERIFSINPENQTPAYTMQDGVDYIPMPWWRAFLIQFLNIAGLGPIVGAVLGAAYGPVAFVWIVLGNILGGAVHDYFSGMISIRMGGMSIPEIIGKYLGLSVKQFMRGFTLILMILVGAAFISGPAALLSSLTPSHLTKGVWVVIILFYYIIATLLPIDKIIGRFYPIFGLALIVMAVGITIVIFTGGYIHDIPEVWNNFHNMKANADKYPLFPMLFVTISCGAISGFHSTQSPMMARCLKNEKEGRKVFYGAMVTEGIVALIWAAIGMSFYGGVNQLNSAIAGYNGEATIIIREISNTTLGTIGGILAILGVVAAPITTGDTAFRSARLIVADFLRFPQKKLWNRVMVSLPLFVIGFTLTQVKFDIIWRYMFWSNQVLATVVLWAITVYLAQQKKLYIITLIPALFMTAVVTNYILIAPEGFQLAHWVGLVFGIAIPIACLAVFARYLKR